MLQELVRHFVENIVNDPSSVLVTWTESDEQYTIKIRVDKDDIARVIGSEGRVFRAIRSVVKLVNTKQSKDVVVDIAE